MARTLLFCSLVILSRSAYAQNGELPEPPSVEAAVARVERHVSAVERRMAQEEQRLQARMAQIAKMRKNAVKREDQRALQSIEAMEKQAFTAYKNRMNRILAELNGDPTQSRTARQPTTKQPTTKRRSNSRRQVKVAKRRTSSQRGGAARGYKR